MITTERLHLWPMTANFLAASLAGDVQAAEAELGAKTSPEWFDERELMQVRLEDLRLDQTAHPWLLRAVIEQATQQMVGHAGFHTPPNPSYLADISPGAVEFGYSIYTPYRRRGFARETALGLMRWASQEHGVAHFIASASPQNAPSLALLRQLGFVKIGSHVDEVDGDEDIFRLRIDELPPAYSFG